MNETATILPKTGNNAPAGTAGDAAAKNNLDGWKNDAKSRILNLSTSNTDILDFITSAAQDDKNSQAKMQCLNYLLNMRAEIGNLLTNALKTMFDTSAAVVRNMRS